MISTEVQAWAKHCLEILWGFVQNSQSFHKFFCWTLLNRGHINKELWKFVLACSALFSNFFWSSPEFLFIWNIFRNHSFLMRFANECFFILTHRELHLQDFRCNNVANYPLTNFNSSISKWDLTFFTKLVP